MQENEEMIVGDRPTHVAFRGTQWRHTMSLSCLELVQRKPILASGPMCMCRIKRSNI